jgi:hypothetical protein
MTAREPQQLAQDEIQAAAAGYRADNADFARWARGYGVISHNDATQVKIHALAAHLQQQGLVTGPGSVYRMLAAAATGLGEPPGTLLNAAELGALMGETGPDAVFEPLLHHVG